MPAGRDGFIPPYMDIQTVAEHVCASVPTIERWVKQGDFPPPCRKIGGKNLWSWADIEKHLLCKEDCATGALPDPVADRIRASVQRLLADPSQDGRRKTRGVSPCPAASPPSPRSVPPAKVLSLRSSKPSE